MRVMCLLYGACSDWELCLGFVPFYLVLYDLLVAMLEGGWPSACWLVGCKSLAQVPMLCHVSSVCGRQGLKIVPRLCQVKCHGLCMVIMCRVFESNILASKTALKIKINKDVMANANDNVYWLVCCSPSEDETMICHVCSVRLWVPGLQAQAVLKMRQEL